MNQESLRLLIQRKIQDGRLPRGRWPSAIAGRPGDGSRCGACDQIVKESVLMMLVPLTEGRRGLSDSDTAGSFAAGS